jgi:hypothetical protein
LIKRVKINVPISGEEHGFEHALHHQRRETSDAPYLLTFSANNV